MEQFYKFTQFKVYGENSYERKYKRKPIYIKLDSIVSVFENHYGTVHETVVGLANGSTFTIEEPMDEVMDRIIDAVKKGDVA